MTQDEALALLASTHDALQSCYLKIDEIETRHTDAMKDETAPFEKERERLTSKLIIDGKRCVREADFLPFKHGEFITNDGARFFEVSSWDIEFDGDKSLRTRLLVCQIRKSGTLSRYTFTLPRDKVQHYRKADISEHLCLRRALRQRLRKRLEGGE